MKSRAEREELFKKSPVYYIDFDNTLWNTQKIYVDTYNGLFLKNADWTKSRTWDLEDVCEKRYTGFARDMFDQFIWDHIQTLYDHQELSIGAYYYDNAMNVTNRFVEDGKVFIVTVGTDANIYHKGKYIHNTLSRKISKLYIAEDEGFDVKAKIDMSDGIIIEDRTDVLHQSNALYKIRFGKEFDWNMDWKPDNITTFSCETWLEVEELVKRLRN